jgi:hypothetical protein
MSDEDREAIIQIAGKSLARFQPKPESRPEAKAKSKAGPEPKAKVALKPEPEEKS